MKMRWIEASGKGVSSEQHLDRAAEVEMDALDEVLGGFRAPVMLAAWPGIANVGVGAIDYLRQKLDARAFAEIDTRDLFTADLILVENGLAKLPDVPTHTFSLVEDPPLVIFQSGAQMGGTVGNDMMGHVLDMAQGLGVQTIYTMAAY
ncbi:MAG: PAC2 family protein, partial [bacterium]|nr:PAC2 family protein [bacterium]